MEAIVYNQKGKESGKVSLPENVFGLAWNADLVHQVVTSMLTAMRKPYAHTKTRGEVRGGGKKPWKQKGTGRARHGSTRSPIWVGGGVAHGPRNDKNFDRKINKKMKTKALYTLLSKKWSDGEIIFVDSISLSKPKTSEAVLFLNTVSSIKGFEKMIGKKQNSALVSIPDNNIATKRAFANIGNILVEEARNMNPVNLLNYKYLVVSSPKEFVDSFSAKVATK